MSEKDRFLTPKESAKILGLHSNTLRKYSANGIIEHIRSAGGKRYYNVDKYLRNKGIKKEEIPMEEKDNPRKNHICYCRVSKDIKKAKLYDQIKILKIKYPTYEFITDISSKSNLNRVGLEQLLDIAIKGKLETLILMNKDRLCEIEVFKVFEMIFTKYSKTKIIIESTDEIEQEIQKLLNPDPTEPIKHIVVKRRGPNKPKTVKLANLDSIASVVKPVIIKKSKPLAIVESDILD